MAENILNVRRNDPDHERLTDSLEEAVHACERILGKHKHDEDDDCDVCDVAGAMVGTLRMYEQLMENLEVPRLDKRRATSCV